MSFSFSLRTKSTRIDYGLSYGPFESSTSAVAAIGARQQQARVLAVPCAIGTRVTTATASGSQSPYHLGMRQGTITVDGDVTVAYCEIGDGPPIVCLPGWSQAAEQFIPLMEELASSHRMIALDHRGHGRSSQPGRGYRLHRLAADLHEVLTALDLGQTTLLGHSMGVAVIWAYLDVFGDNGIDHFVFADSRPTLVRDRDWSDTEARIAGGTQTLAQLEDLTHRLRSPDGWNVLIDVVRHMVSPDLPPERIEALIAIEQADDQRDSCHALVRPMHLRLARPHPDRLAADSCSARPGQHDPGGIPAVGRRHHPARAVRDYSRRRRRIAFRILGKP